MAKQTLAILPDTFTIHSLPVDTPIPAQIFAASMYFIGKTREELSLVVTNSVKVDSDASDPGWRVLEVLGPLQLSMVGIMARISSVLANARVSIFVVSTFETDYFLVKEEDLLRAKEALVKDGYKVTHD